MIVLRAWLTARAWRELAYLVAGVFAGLPTFVLALVGVAAAAASVLTVGLPLLVGVLAFARLTPGYFRGPARRLLGWDWGDPPPLPARTRWGRIRALPSDPTAWRALAYCLARWPLMLAGAYPGLISVGLVPVGITYPLWWWLVPAEFPAFGSDTWAGTWWIALQCAALLVAMPWWLRMIVLLDRFLVRGLLHPSRSQQRIAELEAGRTALQSDAAAMLRRVERDLHDGTQARLVTLGLTLSRIESRSTEEPVRALAADARGTVTEALAELRDIVRGMHPPALDDGLAVALSTLAARSAVPAEVTVALTTRPPDATASALYFAAAELLTNIARHSGASRVHIDLRSEPGKLRLSVTDNGHGGAAVTAPARRPADPLTPADDSTEGPARDAPGPTRTSSAPQPGPAAAGQTSAAPPPGPSAAGPRRTGSTASGTGLAGLARRAAALDGALTIDSPAGGPTTVTMTLPERV